MRTKNVARDPATADNVPVTEHDPPLLYNLRPEVSETTEISGRYPEIGQRLLHELLEIEKDLQL